MLDRLLLYRLRPLSTALAVSCLGPCVLFAQDAPYRPALAALRIELDSARSVADVDAIAHRWDASGPPAVGRLASAYIELQRGVVTNSKVTLTSAWERFDQVVRVHPDWPYARLGLAEAALEIYSRRYPLPATYDDVAGGTHYDGFTIQMKRTLRTEPSFQPFQNELGRKLYAEICGSCWSEWLKAQQQMINHYGLNVRDPKAKEMLLKSMEQFLFAGGQIQLS